ncbi:MAG: ABC transporter permease [Lachnospira sp.]
MRKFINVFGKGLYFIVPALFPVIFLLVWQIAGVNEWIDISILSYPEEVIECWGKYLRNGKYLKYLIDSTYRFFMGFFFGSLAGLILGLIMGLSKWVSRIFSATTSLLRSIPLIAWVPICILSLGTGETTRILLVSIGCFWSVFINTMDGIKGVDYKLVEVAKELEKNWIVTVTEVIIPAAFPSIVTGLRSGFSMSWKSIVAAEMIGASSGIGFIISYAREIQRPDMMYIGLVTVAIIGLILDIILVRIQDSMLSRYSNKSGS